MRGPRAILFPEELCHCDIFKPEAVLSAGFVNIEGVAEKPYGSGQSFKSTKVKKAIESLPEDYLTINQTLIPGMWDYTVDMEMIDDKKTEEDDV